MKEYESRIHEFRRKKGLTMAALSRLAKVRPTELYAMADGRSAPIYVVTGRTKQSAFRLAAILNTEVEDLFPAYFCKLELEYDKKAPPLTDVQILDISHSHSCQQPDQEVDPNDFWDLILNKLKLSNGETRCLWLYFHEGCTLEEVGEIIRIHKERVRQKIATALRKLRHPKRRKEIILFFEEATREREYVPRKTKEPKKEKPKPEPSPPIIKYDIKPKILDFIAALQRKKSSLHQIYIIPNHDHTK